MSVDLSLHEYELTTSETLTFLYNLLYDPHATLTREDILRILHQLKLREDHMGHGDIQDLQWPPGLRNKFYADRRRVGRTQWFYNVPMSRIRAQHEIQTHRAQCTDFFAFHRFFGRLKLHITHFQLRNLVCCAPDISKGIYYPSSHHDYIDECAYFRVNRLTTRRNDYSLDCAIDSRSLRRNAVSRVSTISASNDWLAIGTFEGGYILRKNQSYTESGSGAPSYEHHLTSDPNGITNHIVIHGNQLIISSNDRWVRVVDTANRPISSLETPFTVNCAALNPHNSRELLVTGDSVDASIMDLRSGNRINLSGHRDYGFACDWSPKSENTVVTGNQDGTVRLWDRRWTSEATHIWGGSLGVDRMSEHEQKHEKYSEHTEHTKHTEPSEPSEPSEYSENSEYSEPPPSPSPPPSSLSSGPIRNLRFSCSGDFLAWAESLDHIGVLRMDDVVGTQIPRVQSIDFIGKCTGLSFAPVEDGGEQMVVGVNDCPMGGILSYKTRGEGRMLDFEFAL